MKKTFSLLTVSVLALSTFSHSPTALAQSASASASESAGGQSNSTQTSPVPNELSARPDDKSQTDWKAQKSWAGDLRYRVHNVKNSLDDTHIYQQLRARLGYKADIERDLTGILRFATAISPISANQTLGDAAAPGMQRRAFGLDLAYLEYRPVAGVQTWLGKTPVPFYAPAKIQLVWDADMDLEGAAAKWTADLESVTVFANVGASIISDNYRATVGIDDPDFGFVGEQVGATLKTFGSWTAHVAAYQYPNAQGRTAPSTGVVGQVTSGSTSNGRYFGNSLNGSQLASNFSLFEVGVSWQHNWGIVESELFYDTVRNTVSNFGGAAYETGVVLRHGAWSITWANIFKEADSVVGAFTDSDSNGGGTDNVGERANITWQMTKNVALSLTDFRAKRSISNTQQTDFGDTMLDLQGAF